MLQHVVHEAAAEGLAKGREVVLSCETGAHAVVVEDLDELGEGCSLVEHALNGHLDLELARGFKAVADSFTDTFHYQVG